MSSVRFGSSARARRCASRLLVGSFWLVACSGGEFRASTQASACADDSCAGETAGGANGDAGEAHRAGRDGTAGDAAGGQPSGGSNPIADGGASAGVAAVGGGGQPGGGVGGTGGGGIGGVNGAFPATSLLDDFNREGPELGGNWLGATGEYALTEKSVWCEYCTQAALWSERFGAQQEVFATLTAFDGDANEINLVLKAQEDAGCNMIELLYSPAAGHVRIAFCAEGAWTDLDPVSLLLEPGDRLGARGHADGSVEAFVNGVSFETFDVSDYPFASGRIGINGVSGDNGLRWDDFGGGSWM
jgi:hypothetical protein